MRKSILIPLCFGTLMLVVHVVHYFTNTDFSSLGIYPKNSSTLIGIFTSPLIHGNWEHLFSNLFPLLILGSILFVSYKKMAIWVWLLNYIITGILVWLFARSNSYHIGASGIIYGLASFLLFSGFFRMDVKSIAIASGVALFYGGMVWGILPIQAGVSWESHLFGAVTGLVLAFIFRNVQKEEIIIRHEEESIKRKTFEDYLKSRH
jgi:membrane associated rhomboid family serine protease